MLRGVAVPIPATLDAVATEIVDAAMAVHSALGPGLLESVYETCLLHELRERGLTVDRQVELSIKYRKINLDGGLRLDLLVSVEIIVEIKAVESIRQVHVAQLLTYLKLADKRLGFLLNFNVSAMKHGIRRIAL